MSQVQNVRQLSILHGIAAILAVCPVALAAGVKGRDLVGIPGKGLPVFTPVYNDNEPKLDKRADCKGTNGDGYLQYLDWFLEKKFDPKGAEWDEQFFKYAVNEDKSCSALSTSATCTNDLKCDAAGYGKESFWIAKALVGYHAMLESKKNIAQNVIVTKGFNITSRMEEDFKLADKDPENPALDWIVDTMAKAFTWGMSNVASDEEEDGDDKGKPKEKGGFNFKPSEAIGAAQDVGNYIVDSVKELATKDEKPTTDLQSAMQIALANFADGVGQASLKLSDDFYHRGNLSSWSPTSFPFSLVKYHHGVPNFLAGGRFTDGFWESSDESKFQSTLDKFVRSGLAAIGLTADNYYIMVGNTNPDNCGTDGHSTRRLIDGQCHALHKPGPGWQQVSSTDPGTWTTEIDEDFAKKLASDYLVDFDMVFASSIKCQKANGKYSHQLDMNSFNGIMSKSGNLEDSCFFNMPVIYADTADKGYRARTPCAVQLATQGTDAGKNYLPKNLADIFGKKDFCNNADKTQVPVGGTNKGPGVAGGRNII